ncbi:hypothetical protein E2C01_030163 [Portunus trituberculatus]|uniref:Uncharacterized protein n=1 Tax=Portunus trituberculatus TaxID=210409 RepID=A0A5B7ETH3_PORTR|nr:hypothetical protein [Portunus trituberculatus]
MAISQGSATGSREQGPPAPSPSPPTRLTIVTHGTNPATTPPPGAVHFLQPCSHGLVLIHHYTYALSLVCQKPTFSTAKAAIFTAVQQCNAGQYSVQIVNDSVSSATAQGPIGVKTEWCQYCGNLSYESQEEGVLANTLHGASTSHLLASQQNIEIMRFNIICFLF